MKYLIFVTGFFFVVSSFANKGLENSEIARFYGSYANDRGSARAATWQLPGEAAQNNVTFEVFKENQQIRLVTPQAEFLFDEVPEFLMDLESLSWRDANVSTGGQSIHLSLENLLGQGAGQRLELKELAGNCQGSNLNGNFVENLINACTSAGTLSFKQLTTVEALRRSGFSLYKFFEQILKGNHKTNTSSLTLENFELKVLNKKFDLKVKADLSISATIKANGSFEYQQDRVTIRIDKVKASFLTITDKVFDELEKIQDPKVIVNRPFVTILLQ